MTSENVGDSATQSDSLRLSHRFEELMYEFSGKSLDDPPFHFDVVIVGSGYGGSIAAAQLAGRHKNPSTDIPLRICVLERGKRYVAGMFPTSEAELPRHVRFSTAGNPKPRGNQDGLLDVRVGPDVSALVACGLGGGSLINAGVMATIGADAWPKDTWPSSMSLDLLGEFYDRAKLMLGAKFGEKSNTIKSSVKEAPLKFKALRRLGGEKFVEAPLSISMTSRVNEAGVRLDACNHCGDCATGCNFNAKNSLDQNLLVQARRHGAHIYTGATVTSLAKLAGGGWTLRVVHTDAALRRRAPNPMELRTRNVILAAGTFGSTEILLRSATDELRFSQLLGQRFSTNGDALAVAYKQNTRVNAVVDESIDPDHHEGNNGRNVGPTITGIIDRRNELTAPGTIEEFSIPGAMRRLFAESFTLARCLYKLSEPDKEDHEPEVGDGIDPMAVNNAELLNTQVFGLMGHDGAKGSLELVAQTGDDDGDVSDGSIRVRWSAIREDSSLTLFDDQIKVLKQLVSDSQSSGEVLPNPIWRPLPNKLEGVLDVPKGPVITVHPLGGCPMGDDVGHGVVDHIGRVFDPRQPAGIHNGLVVLDGSIIPTSLGINPALTIAAVALRAIEKLQEQWGYMQVKAESNPLPERPEYPRPKFQKRTATKVEIMERLSGAVILNCGNGDHAHRVVELTLKFQPIELVDLMTNLKRDIESCPSACLLRTYLPDDWESMNRYDYDDAKRDEMATGIYRVAGTLSVLNRESSSRRQRTWRARWAYVLNRGLRDSYQWFADLSGFEKLHSWSEIRKRKTLSDALASRAGEVRRFDYALRIEETRKTDKAMAVDKDKTITGNKRFTYERKANPWNQLQRMTLTKFPACDCTVMPAPTLNLDLGFLAGKGIPLFRLTEQDNHASALFDLASFLLYFARLMIGMHTWSLRNPDPNTLREPQRLPRELSGWRKPKPKITEIEVGRHADGTPARVRLTRYARSDSTHHPLVMIHGYSASGTTFSHPVVRPNLASYMWDRHRDVWILDLRTSSGMPTAVLPWTFEQAAHEDIPAALTYIERCVTEERRKQEQIGARKRGGETKPMKVDVIAHCMGSAMMTMAILGRPQPGDAYFTERDRLPMLIDKLILSQVAPITVFSSANVFRAYAMGFLRNLLPLSEYQFRPAHKPTAMEQMMDRVFSTMPYSDDEYRIENPLWPWAKTPWVRTRHRMDALYARDFNVENVSQDVLDQIDDFFGPLNMDTVLNAINFARTSLITNHAGRNAYVKAERLYERWRNISTLCVHGRENGLADVSTIYRMKDLMRDSRVSVFRTFIKDGYGHQDCLIGRDSVDVFENMYRFLIDPQSYPIPKEANCPRVDRFVGGECRVGVPWLGPVRGEFDQSNQELSFAIAPDPKVGVPSHILFAAVVKSKDWNDRNEQTQRYELRGASDGENVVDQPWLGYGYGLHSVRMRLEDLHSTSHRTDYCILALLFYDPRKTAGEDAPAAYRSVVEKLLSCTLAKEVATSIAYDASERVQNNIDSSEQTVTFAIGSCHYPPGAIDSEVASASYRRLAKLLDGEGRRPSFLVLMGDQIYSDVTGGLFDPTVNKDRYVIPYEKWLQQESVRSVLRRIPTYMMLDDHEIEDNWEPIPGDDKARNAVLKLGRTGYLTYQRANGPSVQSKGGTRYPLWYSASPCKLPMFFVDSRTDRQPRTIDTIENARMFGAEQFNDLIQWLRTAPREPTLPRFVVSSSMLLPRKLDHSDSLANAIRSDSWQGYPATFYELLACIADGGKGNLVFLSGDEHHSCVASVSIKNVSRATKPVDFHSIHCSGMYSPFPFANGKPEDLICNESFEFMVGDNEYRCNVSTKLIRPGDGFATISCVRSGDAWSVDFHFDASGEKDTLTSYVKGEIRSSQSVLGVPESA